MMTIHQNKTDSPVQSLNQTSKQASNLSIAQLIDAGIGLAMLPLSLVQKTLTLTKEETSTRLSSLQARGEKVDENFRNSIANIEQLGPIKLCNKLLSAVSNKPSKDEKIEQLSSKVDTLVELVATLAAKKAAEQASASPTVGETTPAPKKRAPRTATTKAAVKPEPKPAPKPRARRTTQTAVKKDSE
jgi:Lon protease-like protein